ncbi:MAG TPA: hypothetical protein VER33_23755 [Polyangiaceae bacterium]|nr:hypothetical protein [Polyangiaceae bacterium]
MSPTQVRLVALRAEVERDWQQVLRHAATCSATDPALGAPQAALVALSLDHAYQAFEQLLVRVEKALRLPERAGQNWHRQLLADASEALPRVRPAMIPKAAERDWEHLLGFRHFLRHAYAVELDPERLLGNTLRLQRAVAATQPCMDDLLSALAPDESR